MRLVVQRVNSASVKIVDSGKISGSIGKGLFVLLGVGRGDTKQMAKKLAEKVSKLRIMSDKEGKMNLSLTDAHGSILVVSQFTLYGDTSGGNRPSFIKAEDPKVAKLLYEYFIECLQSNGLKVETGIFGEYMEIKNELDGPVTLILEE